MFIFHMMAIKWSKQKKSYQRVYISALFLYLFLSFLLSLVTLGLLSLNEQFTSSVCISVCARVCLYVAFCHCSFLQFPLLYQDADWQRYLLRILPLNNLSISITLSPHTPGLGVQWWWHGGTVAHQKGLLEATWLSRWKYTNHLFLHNNLPVCVFHAGRAS